MYDLTTKSKTHYIYMIYVTSIMLIAMGFAMEGDRQYSNELVLVNTPLRFSVYDVITGERMTNCTVLFFAVNNIKSPEILTHINYTGITKLSYSSGIELFIYAIEKQGNIIFDGWLDYRVPSMTREDFNNGEYPILGIPLFQTPNILLNQTFIKRMG